MEKMGFFLISKALGEQPGGGILYEVDQLHTTAFALSVYWHGTEEATTPVEEVRMISSFHEGENEFIGYFIPDDLTPEQFAMWYQAEVDAWKGPVAIDIAAEVADEFKNHPLYAEVAKHPVPA